jgi:DNA-binding transcriptional LysR family regulator
MDKLLQQFLAIAEAGSISAATAALHVTQPTLTFNMRKLEENLSVKLFERSSQGMRLTPYGETLYESARLMQRLHDNMLSSIEQQRARNERGISMGSGYSWWTLFIKDMMIAYQRDFPNAPVQVSLGNQLRCMDQLLSGDISLFVAHQIEGLNPGIGAEFIRLSQVYNGLFVREGHPLLGKPRTIAEIEAYPFVTTSPPESRHQRFFDRSWRRTRVETVFDTNGFAFASNSLAACIDYTRSTDGVLRFTHLMAPSFAEQGLLEVKPVEPGRRVPMGIYVLAEQRGEARIEKVIERVAAAASAVLPPIASDL